MGTFCSTWSACQSTQTDDALYYSSDWQVLQDRADTAYSSCASGSYTVTDPDTLCTTTTPTGGGSCSYCYGHTDQNVWGLGYVDDLVLRDRSADGVVALDISFGSGGEVTTSFSGYAGGYTLAVQPDGKTLLAGYGAGTGGAGWYLARYNANGSLDSTFGTGGLVVTGLSSSDAWTGAVAESDGKIVLGGFSDPGTSTGTDFTVARYNADGTLDTTFGTGGVVTTDFAGGYDAVRGLSVLPDGSVVAVGDEVDATGNRTFALAKYTPAGALDTSFGTGGKVTTTFSGYADAYGDAVAVQPDGKVVMLGSSTDSSGSGTATTNDWLLARYNPDGTPDSSFGTSGKVTLDFNGGSDNAWGLALAPDGKIVASGNETDGMGQRVAVARFNPDGSLDTTFSTTGMVTGFASGSHAYAARVDGLGRITVAGDSGGDFALARYEPDGSLDTGFGSSGTITTDFGSSDWAFSIALTSDGGVIAAGTSGSSFALARYGPGSGWTPT